MVIPICSDDVDFPVVVRCMWTKIKTNQLLIFNCLLHELQNVSVWNVLQINMVCSMIPWGPHLITCSRVYAEDNFLENQLLNYRYSWHESPFSKADKRVYGIHILARTAWKKSVNITICGFQFEVFFRVVDSSLKFFAWTWDLIDFLHLETMLCIKGHCDMKIQVCTNDSIK